MLAPLDNVSLRRTIPAAALALALIASGCGGDDQKPLSQRTATALIADLDEATQRVGADKCEDARRGTLVRLKRKVERLPEGTDDAIRTTLEDGVSRLEELIDAECEKQDREREKRREEEQQQQEEEEVPTAPPETQPPPVETQPPPAETQPEPKPEKPPKDEDDGGSGGVPAPDAGGAGKKGK